MAEDGGSPWTLTKVCRAFRTAALSTPRIWGGISLWGGDWLASGVYTRSTTRTVRWKLGKENCFNAKQVREALNRAKAAPLDLAINWRWNYSRTINDMAKEMITMVAGERLSQWRSLEFAVEGDWDLGDICSGSLEGLTFLRLDSFHQGLYDCACKTARNLRNVEIHMRNQPLSKLTNAPWWQHVHRLLLAVPLDPAGSRTVQCHSAVDILSKAVELEDLNVQFGHHSDFIPIQKRLRFFRMKKLILSNSAALLRNISAPSLTHLEIQRGGWGDGASFKPGSIFFPAVTHLSVFSSAEAVLAAFRCPSLVQLCLGAYPGTRIWDDSNRMIDSAWYPKKNSRKHLKPSVLKIEGVPFRWGVLLDLLRFSLHDCLRELSLVDIPLSIQFFKALTAVTPQNVICENLEKLSIIYSPGLDKSVRIMGWDEGKAVLKSIFTLRREQNLALRRVTAQWHQPRMVRVEFGDDDESGMSGVSAGAA